MIIRRNIKLHVKQQIKDTFFKLNSLIGVSGAEFDLIRYCRDELKDYANDYEVMPTGNLIVKLNSGKPGPKVMITAHTDEIGLIVKNITEDGFILFERVGNLQQKVMPASRVLIQADTSVVYGVVGIRPGHVSKPKEALSVQTSEDSYIDIGANSREQVEQSGIHVGTRMVIDAPAIQLSEDIISGRAVDDRLGCAVLIELCKTINKDDFSGVLYFVFSVQEETGVIGAAQASVRISPDYCIVLDTFPAGGTPDVDNNRLTVAIGKGPVISMFDSLPSALVGFPQHPALIKKIKQISVEKNIPIQYTTMCEDRYGTDAIGIVKNGSMSPCLALGIPRRYSHSPAELFNINDAVHVFQLIQEYILSKHSIRLEFLD